jgi:hypothetical protein
MGNNQSKNSNIPSSKISPDKTSIGLQNSDLKQGISAN